MKYVLGIDIGGTSIKGSIVDSSGKVYDKYSIDIIQGESQEDCISRLVKATKDYLLKMNIKIEGIGLGIPGSIDSKKGYISFSNNLKWEHFYIVDFLQKSFDLPIKITNDANAAALGEAIFGSGKEYNYVVMITLGTGVGSGIIINGDIYEGKNGMGAEIGHTSLFANGLRCTCGRKGCLEMYASASALIRQTQAAMNKNKQSLMWEISKNEGKVNGKVAFEAAKLNDKTAIKVINNYVKYLSLGIMNICNVFRPDCIVLSGGIANQGEYLTEKIVKYVEKYDYGYPLSPKTEIKVAKLGYNSGIIGAACLFLKELK